ncbi:imelysin family protein [Streptomyces puniciscabiei]
MTSPGRRARSTGRGTRGAALLVLAAVVALVLTRILWDTPGEAVERATAHTEYPTLPHTAVQASQRDCGAGWSSGRSGLHVFDVHGSGGGKADVQLVEPSGGRVVGEVEGLAPHTSRPLLVRLAAGHYAFRCLLAETRLVTGPTVTVSGGGPGTTGVVPVTQKDLAPAAQAYQRWVAVRLSTLLSQVTALRKAVSAGDLTRARTDWLTAHLSYERLGAAYGAFGDSDEAINGTGPGGTGYHRIEHGLWHGESAASLEAPAARLVRDVGALKGGWRVLRADTLLVRFPAQLLGVRAQEIVENTIEFELTGRTDEGSGSNLLTAQANLDGTAEVLGILRPLLSSRMRLAPVDAALAAARGELRTLHVAPLDRISRTRHEELNARFGALVEQLAPIAAVCEERRTS